MKNFIYQPYHLVSLSPWPLLTSLNLMFTMISVTKMFNLFNKMSLLLSFIMLLLCSYQWWRDITRESTFQGYHTMLTIKGLKLGMILFIISEVFFFISFFWSYFHSMLSSSIDINNNWPPFNMNSILINPYDLPLLNTIILVSSGMFLSLAHYSMIKKNYFYMDSMILLTLIFGLIFTLIQLFEYLESNFMINSSIYGSTFFMMTGFHGIHVFIGTLFILIIYMRLNYMHLTNLHHLGFEASAWYWHFVDVVWLFLYLFIYWWPY